MLTFLPQYTGHMHCWLSFDDRLVNNGARVTKISCTPIYCCRTGFQQGLGPHFQGQPLVQQATDILGANLPQLGPGMTDVGGIGGQVPQQMQSGVLQVQPLSIVRSLFTAVAHICGKA